MKHEAYTAPDFFTVSMAHTVMSLKLRYLIAAVGGFIFLCGLGYIASLSTAFAQEPDTPAILRAALRLELTRTGVASVNNSQQRLLVRNNAVLTRYLQMHSWQWSDQLGARAIYDRNTQKLNANCGMYSRLYMICDLDRSPEP